MSPGVFHLWCQKFPAASALQGKFGVTSFPGERAFPVSSRLPVSVPEDWKQPWRLLTLGFLFVIKTKVTKHSSESDQTLTKTTKETILNKKKTKVFQNNKKSKSHQISNTTNENMFVFHWQINVGRDIIFNQRNAGRSSVRVCAHAGVVFQYTVTSWMTSLPEAENQRKYFWLKIENWRPTTPINNCYWF